MKSHSAADARPHQLQKIVLPALFHLRCPSQSHQRSARGRTRLTTVTSISCRSLQHQLLYLLLSPDAERPLLRLLAHSGARYEISDLRETYGAGRRNSAGSSGGCSSGGRPQSAPFWWRVRRVLSPRSSLETRGVPASGTGPSTNGTWFGGWHR